MGKLDPFNSLMRPKTAPKLALLMMIVLLGLAAAQWATLDTASLPLATAARGLPKYLPEGAHYVVPEAGVAGRMTGLLERDSTELSLPLPNGTFLHVDLIPQVNPFVSEELSDYIAFDVQGVALTASPQRPSATDGAAPAVRGFAARLSEGRIRVSIIAGLPGTLDFQALSLLGRHLVGADAAFFEREILAAHPDAHVSYYADDHGWVNGDVDRHVSCGNDELPESHKHVAAIDALLSGSGRRAAESMSGTRRTYRLAWSMTQGAYDCFSGDTGALNDMASMTILHNTVFGQFLSIQFVQVSGLNTVDKTGSVAAFSGASCPGGLINGANTDFIDGIVGSSNYDFGHAYCGLSGGCVSGGGYSFSGVSYYSRPCDSSNKGGTSSGINNVPFSVGTGMRYGFVHETAHAFTASHSWSSSLCPASQFPTGDAYEIGAGASIMGYSTCGADNLGKGDWFFSNSVLQMRDFVLSKPTCGVHTAVSGSAPASPSIPTTFTIPGSAMFKLSGASTSSRTSALMFRWDEFDLAPTSRSLASGAQATGPTFRSFAASETGHTRTYPLNPPAYAKGEQIPSVSRTLNFRLTVHDMEADGFWSYSDLLPVVVDTDVARASITSIGVVGGNASELQTSMINRITYDMGGTDGISAMVSVAVLSDALDDEHIVASSVANDGSIDFVVNPGLLGNGTVVVRLYHGDGTFGWFEQEPDIVLRNDGPSPPDPNLAGSTTASVVSPAQRLYSYTFALLF